jgi:predicted RNase H-like nuclease (RuvC/YqgF family)
MVRSSSAEPVAKPKRKGTRSVSTLTPSQLARKRANDREAQRAIRARTKEHIDRLERELEDLKSKQNRDQTVQELLRRNKALEEELARLKENMGVSMTSSPYSTPGMLPPYLWHCN